jgi:hypothetical protein
VIPEKPPAPKRTRNFSRQDIASTPPLPAVLPGLAFDQRIGPTRAFAQALDAPADPDLTEEPFLEESRSRVFNILAGYEFQGDHVSRAPALLQTRREPLTRHWRTGQVHRSSLPVHQLADETGRASATRNLRAPVRITEGIMACDVALSGHIGQRNQRRRIGPPRAEHFGLRAHVDCTEASKSAWPSRPAELHWPLLISPLQSRFRQNP